MKPGFPEGRTKAGTGLGTEAGSWRGPRRVQGEAGPCHLKERKAEPAPPQQEDSRPQAWRERAKEIVRQQKDGEAEPDRQKPAKGRRNGEGESLGQEIRPGMERLGKERPGGEARS